MNPERGDKDLESEGNRDLEKGGRRDPGGGQRERVTWKARHNKGAEFLSGRFVAQPGGG